MKTKRSPWKLIHMAIASSPLLLLALVLGKLLIDDANTAPLSPLRVAVLLLVILVAAGGVWIAVERRLSRTTLLGCVGGLVTVTLLYPLDRCQLSIGVSDYAARRLPLASPECCSHLGALAVCRRAESERRERLRPLDLDVTIEAQARLEAARKEALRAERAAKAEQARGPAEAARRWAERERAAHRERLVRRLRRLRAAGGDFSSLSPLSAERRTQDAGSFRDNGCGEGATQLDTLETERGWFVPVAAHNPSVCEWKLWFVPRPDDAEPTMFPNLMEEFDLSFTHRMLLADLDSDDEPEAVVVRGWEHPEGIGSGTVAIRFLPDGGVVETPFTDVRDVDGDGLVDALLGFDSTYNDAGCTMDEGDYWSPIDLRGPELLLQRLPQGGLSMSTETAKRHRAKACATLGPLELAAPNRRVNEFELIRLVSCRLANGEAKDVLRRELSAVCNVPYTVPNDCEKRRPSVCVFDSSIAAWIDNLEVLRKYSPRADGGG